MSGSRGGKGKSRKGNLRSGYSLGVTDESIALVPRTTQAPRVFHLKSLVPFASNAITGELNFTTSSLPYLAVSGLCTNAPDWGDVISGGYDEFYVESIHVRFVPVNRYSKVTTVTASFTVGLDVDSSTSAITEAKALCYGTAKVMSLDDPGEILYQFPKSTTSGFVWRDVATADQPGCFFAYHDGISLGVANAYGTWYFDTVVVARGRR